MEIKELAQINEKAECDRKAITRDFLYLLNRCFHPENMDEKMERRLQSDEYDWEPMLSLAESHNLLALIFELASEIYHGFAASKVFQKYFPKVMGSAAGQMKRTEMMFDIYDKLRSQGVHPLIMKGIVCRELYGKYADYRPSADEDFLIVPDEFQQTKAILTDHDYYIESKEGYDRILEEIQEVTFYHDGGLAIELHLNPIGQENAVKHTYNAYFDGFASRYIEYEINGHLIRTMTHTDHYLFLVFHALKHFFCGGVGIRQVLDILLFREKYLDEIDWEYINKAILESHTHKFYCDLMTIGKRYLGFETSSLESYHPEELLDDMMYSGTFGNDTKEKLFASRMTSMAIMSGRDSGFFKRCMTFIFPPKESFMMFRPELMTKPYLLPLEWVNRWIRFIKKYLAGTSEKENLIKSSVDLGKNRVRLLKKYDILR